MPIVAINTVHIRLSHVEGETRDILQALLLTLRESPGCLGYGMTPGLDDELCWILSGHWASQAEMTEHFSSPQMVSAINLMLALRAHLGFASFCLCEAGK